MALARVKNWVAEVLTYNDLNAEFNNILNNPGSLICPIGFHLTFTDATYDIGASGATRPRNYFGSGTGTFGGTFYIGDTANANVTLGLTINQGAADDEILSLKSSDIAHGITTLTETDTFFLIKKAAATTGGAAIRGLSESTTGLSLYSVETTTDTTKSATATAGVMVIATIKSGTTETTLGANANVIAFADGGNSVRFILDADGDSHQDVGTAWTNFHGHDDHALLSLLSAHVSRRDDPIREKFFSEFLNKRRDVLERVGLVKFNDDGHHFVNMSKLTMANTGAILQAGDRISVLEATIKELTNSLAPPDESVNVLPSPDDGI